MMVNIDDRGTHFQGTAYVNDADPKLPSSMAVIRTSDRANPFKCKAAITAVNPRTGTSDNWENVKQYYPGIAFPAEADIEGEWDAKTFTVRWRTNIGTTGSAVLTRRKADDAPSEYVPEKMDWSGFKSYVAPLLGKRFIFRGQSHPWRLRTKYHRTGRADLHRFIYEDIQVLHRHLSARTRHAFNLEIPNENGAFFSLVQHHGYPTPLLDWSYSPYVGAFFAYRGVSVREVTPATDDDRVRIFLFDQQEWRNDFNQLLTLNVSRPHFSVMDFLAIDNERMIPQQATSTVTNVDDIETYVSAREKEREKTYLRVIDLPRSQRSLAIAELAFMGITAGSLFPGLDGACEELRERFFDS